MDRETKLLLAALRYEQGHPRRTQHILKVYALAGALGDAQGLEPEEQQILRAAAVLHDIPIRYCKEHYQGDASQENQRREAPRMVKEFLSQAGYPADFARPVLELVQSHHCYGTTGSQLLQLLIEADLMVNLYEKEDAFREDWDRVGSLFQSRAGRELFDLQRQAVMKQRNSEQPVKKI